MDSITNKCREYTKIMSILMAVFLTNVGAIHNNTAQQYYCQYYSVAITDSIFNSVGAACKSHSVGEAHDKRSADLCDADNTPKAVLDSVISF